ncbi:MAG: PqqD family protein [Candidatus Zipacnadales bacterium]
MESSNADWRVQPLGDELLIHDSQGRRVCFLNRTARQVWEMASAGKSIEGIVEKIQADYSGVKQCSIRDDVESCLRQLSELGLYPSHDDRG